MRFAGKRAIITGGGDGIGKEYARALVKEGAAVVIADMNEKVGRATAEEFRKLGGKAIHTVTDVSKEDQIEQMAKAAIDAYGGVDILVNNAGAHLTEYNQPCTRLDRTKWRYMLDVNLTGALICASHCYPGMKARGGGVIINQSSMAAYMGRTAYGVSKMALNALTIALANELAPYNIRVNGIAPGMMSSEAAVRDLSEELKQRVLSTQMIKRQGLVADLIGAFIFLCSEESSFMTGQTLLVDGGVVRRL